MTVRHIAVGNASPIHKPCRELSSNDSRCFVVRPSRLLAPGEQIRKKAEKLIYAEFSEVLGMSEAEIAEIIG